MVGSEASRVGLGGGHGLPVAGCTVCVFVCVCVCVTIVLWFSELSWEDRAGLRARGEQCYVPRSDWRVESKFLYFTVSHKEHLRGTRFAPLAPKGPVAEST